jgi:hypothetical protein
MLPAAQLGRADNTPVLVESSFAATQRGLLPSRAASVERKGQVAIQLANVTDNLMRVTDHGQL